MAKTDSDRSRIHVYPGMGATNAMYAHAAWQAIPNAHYHDWPKWNGESTLTDWTSRLVRVHNIEPGDIVCGSSLGGMVAAEIANQVPVSQLILIGSAAHPDEVSRLLAIIHPLIDLAPVSFATRLAGKAPQELSAMFAKSDPGFIRAMCRAIFSWQGCQSPAPTYRIHGENDRVIPPPPEVDLRIDGGHLIAMSHPDACASFISKITTI